MYCIVYFVPAKSVDYHPWYVTQRLLFLSKSILSKQSRKISHRDRTNRETEHPLPYDIFELKLAKFLGKIKFFRIDGNIHCSYQFWILHNPSVTTSEHSLSAIPTISYFKSSTHFARSCVLLGATYNIVSWNGDAEINGSDAKYDSANSVHDTRHTFFHVCLL